MADGRGRGRGALPTTTPGWLQPNNVVASNTKTDRAKQRYDRVLMPWLITLWRMKAEFPDQDQ